MAACQPFKLVGLGSNPRGGTTSGVSSVEEHFPYKEGVGSSILSPRTAAVAQLVERLVVVQVVADSSSAGRPIDAVSQGAARSSYLLGRGFESRHRYCYSDRRG
jgi:hypothetical protein